MKTDIASNGTATLTQDLPDNQDGSKAQRSWRLEPGQVGQHLPMFDGAAAAADLQVSAGDASALRDVAAEFARKRAKGEA